MPQNTIRVCRPSKWGNPFKLQLYTPTNAGMIKTPPEKARALAVANYRNWLDETHFREAEKELRGKNLACWCPLDQPCHADVLLEIANK